MRNKMSISQLFREMKSIPLAVSLDQVKLILQRADEGKRGFNWRNNMNSWIAILLVFSGAG